MAGKRMASTGAASGDGAPAPQERDQVADKPPPEITAGRGPALGAGIVAAALAGAMMAAGPAAAPRRPAARRPARLRRPRVTNPAARWLAPWARAKAAGARTMTPQARAAAAACPGFSGAYLDGVSCTGRSAVHRDRDGHHPDRQEPQAPGRAWNGTSWTVQSTLTTNTGGWLGGTLDGGVSCTSSTACMAAGYSYNKTFSRLLGEGWNGHTWAIQPDSKPATGGQPFGISCRWAKDCTAVGKRLTGMTLAEHWNGRAWSAQTTKHLGALDGVSCPATGNCTAVGSNPPGRRSPSTGTGRRGRTSPWPARSS